MDAQHFDRIDGLGVLGSAGDQVEGTRNILMKPHAHRRERQATRRALEQFASDELFEVGNLMADGRHREAEFFCGLADATKAGDDIECQHTLERREMHGVYPNTNYFQARLNYTGLLTYVHPTIILPDPEFKISGGSQYEQSSCRRHAVPRSIFRASSPGASCPRHHAAGRQPRNSPAAQALRGFG